MKFYYSIRVVEATNLKEAIRKIQDQQFREDLNICDKVLSKTQVLEQVRKMSYKKAK